MTCRGIMILAATRRRRPAQTAIDADSISRRAQRSANGPLRKGRPDALMFVPKQIQAPILKDRRTHRSRLLWPVISYVQCDARRGQYRALGRNGASRSSISPTVWQRSRWRLEVVYDPEALKEARAEAATSRRKASCEASPHVPHRHFE